MTDADLALLWLMGRGRSCTNSLKHALIRIIQSGEIPSDLRDALANALTARRKDVGRARVEIFAVGRKPKSGVNGNLVDWIAGKIHENDNLPGAADLARAELAAMLRSNNLPKAVCEALIHAIKYDIFRIVRRANRRGKPARPIRSVLINAGITATGNVKKAYVDGADITVRRLSPSSYFGRRSRLKPPDV